MLLHARKIIGLPIIESIAGKKLDAIKDIIVDPENGKVLALLIKKQFFWGRNRVVTFKDIVEFYADGVLVKDRDSIVEVLEVFKIKDILDKKVPLLGSQVLTQNGQKLGILEDFLFDTQFQNILTLVVKKRFYSERRIISSERILSILPGKIIIRDAIIKASLQRKIGVLNRLLNTANPL
ncbi:MAG: PRC-barrel domain-containing protein [Patescibacteria group bacterium]|nr:PRC-barrel domain-containing protein [Patescibacteria group bacterium]